MTATGHQTVSNGFEGKEFSMLHLVSHMECGKAGAQASAFTVSDMSGSWSQRSEQNARPVTGVIGYKPATLGNKTGASFREGIRD
jgi:hypothetical protein